MILLRSIQKLLPGLLICAAVVMVAIGLQRLQIALIGTAHLEALVLAILLGVVVRSAVGVPDASLPGITFSGATLLNIAIALLGLSVSIRSVIALGPYLVLAIMAMVCLAIPASYLIGRGFRLGPQLALLVACGNAICGNSAIAAVAPVIGADRNDVAAAISYTAVLGVVMVLSLPIAVGVYGFSQTQYGILSGLTVYAVPQVLAATLPVGAVAAQIGTLVKLIRVAMLGPVVTVLALLAPRMPQMGHAAGRQVGKGKLMPWFILAFFAMVLVRASGVLPDWLPAQAATVSGVLTVMAMAALGLSVDVRAVARAGLRVSATVTLSMLGLTGLSLLLIWLLGRVAA